MSSYIAKPMSKQKIREEANELRNILGMKNEKEFPIIYFLEWAMPQINPEFRLEILSKDQMGSCYGMTYPEDNLIALREDVYERTILGVARDRYTTAHEVGHFIMHTSNRLVFARAENKGAIPSYMNPEWQANVFAAELLAPRELIVGMELDEIVAKCKVSRQVAEIQLKG